MAQFAAYLGHPALGLRIARGRGLDLFEASALGDLAQLERHLAARANAGSETSPDGFSPLGLACFFGHRALVERLLAAGADPRAPSENAMRVTPLHSAVSRGDLELTRLLLGRGAEVNARQTRGYTALHQAAGAGNQALVRLLVERSAVRHARDDEGKTPLDLARERGHPEVVV